MVKTTNQMNNHPFIDGKKMVIYLLKMGGFPWQTVPIETLEWVFCRPNK